MRRIRDKFILAAAIFAFMFAIFHIWYTWSSTRRMAERDIARRTQMALDFDLAIRGHIADVVRPEAQRLTGEDDFIPELMSTSYTARAVFDRVHESNPDYILKFSSDNPRNPANLATPEESAMLQYFRENPGVEEWQGIIDIGGHEYLGAFKPRFVKESCLQCHGAPEDAPASLIERYGDERAFGWKVGQVAALDTVAIPTDAIWREARETANTQMLVSTVWGLGFLLAVLFIFRWSVGDRLEAIGEHFEESQLSTGVSAAGIKPLPEGAPDEIGFLARRYNAFARRLQSAKDGLEQQIEDRTYELQEEVSKRRQAEERFFLAASLNNDSIYEWDIPSESIEWFGSDQNTLGYAINEFPRTIHSLVAMLHPEDQDAAIQAFHANRTSTEPSVGEYRVLGEDGDWRLCTVTSRPVLGNDGRPCRRIGVCTDVTEIRRAGEALADSEGRYRLVAENIHDVIWTVDMNLLCTFVTPAVAYLSGLSPKEARGKSVDQLLGTIGQHAASNALRRRCEEYLESPEHAQRNFTLELPCVNEQYEVFWSESTVTLLVDEDLQPTCFVGVTRNVTERKATERKLRDFATALQKEKLAAESASRAKGAFLANMSHEIRTPMTAILGFTDILLGHTENEESVDAIHTIQRNGEHLLELINNILDLSKIEAGKYTVVPKEVCLQNMMSDLRSLMTVRATAKNLDLKFVTATPIPKHIHTDPTCLRQILLNLIGNAIKFTEVGGVRVEVGLDRQFDGPDRLRIDVIDTGIGFDPKLALGLFEPFSQADISTSRCFGGTGLGLAISRRLANALGGDLEAESECGHGSTFRLYLPCEPINQQLIQQGVELSQPDRAAETNAPTSKMPELNCRILLAEDGLDNQRLISFLLRKAGAEVTIVENGEEAVHEMMPSPREVHPEDEAQELPYDIILMDMQMPIMDGYTATRRLRALGCHAPIVALTAHAMEHERQKCLDAGCDDFVSKPVDRAHLLNVIAKFTSGCLEKSPK